MNSSTPYIQIYIPNSFLFQDNSLTDFTMGYIFGVKSQINQPLRFHVQLSTGAVYWSIPIHYIYTAPIPSVLLQLQDCQIWDCQSSSIQSIVFPFLNNKPVDFRTHTNTWYKGTYLFTIDNVDDFSPTSGYSFHPDAKCYHIISLLNGNLIASPNNHLRWHNADFIVPYPLNSPPKYRPLLTTFSCEKDTHSAGEDELYFYNFNPSNET